MTDTQLLDAPQKIGKFVIERELGRGAMGVVYYGYDPFMDRHVAIKVATERAFKDAEEADKYTRLFYNEARIAGMLDHRFILPIYDAGLEGNRSYLVMECIRNARTLKEFCRFDTLLPVPKVLEILYKCARALDYAHSRGVVHRDIKPANILLTEDLDVKVSDFGVAQIMSGGETEKSEMFGSPRYMSPEQISCKTLTHQTDLYSLGVMMFELLTGKLPFMAETFAELAKEINTREAPLMRAVRAEVPEQLEMVVKRAMAKNPAGRYQRGQDFANDLELAYKSQSRLAQSGDASGMEKFNRLRSNSFYRTFTDAEIREIVNVVEWLEIPSEGVVFSEGELDESFYVIVAGEVKVMKGEICLSTLKPGDCFGEMAYLTKTTRTAGIVAKTNLILVKVIGKSLDRLSLSCQNHFSRVFLSTLIERLSTANQRLAQKKDA